MARLEAFLVFFSNKPIFQCIPYGKLQKLPRCLFSIRKHWKSCFSGENKKRLQIWPGPIYNCCFHRFSLFVHSNDFVGNSDFTSNVPIELLHWNPVQNLDTESINYALFGRTYSGSSVADHPHSLAVDNNR